MENREVIGEILSTICYYDALDCPLTSFEIWKYLTKTDPEAESHEAGLAEILSGLDQLVRRGVVRTTHGFYFLPERENLVGRRLAGNRRTIEKIKRLRRVAYWLCMVPFVRMVLVTGKLALKQSSPRSDWDVLIAIKSGRLWTGRTLVTAFLQLIGKRRHHDLIRNRVCLNHFITDGFLEICQQDFFAAHEYHWTFPLCGQNLFRQFRLKNRWIRRYKPNYRPDEVRDRRTWEDSKLRDRIRDWGEKLFDFEALENWLRRIERQKIRNNPKTLRPGSIIEANDVTLVFLPDPRGPKVFERFFERNRHWQEMLAAGS